MKPKTFIIELIADSRFNQDETYINSLSDKVTKSACWNILNEGQTRYLDWKDCAQYRKEFILITVATKNQIYKWVNDIRPQYIKFIQTKVITIY